jgi:beta-glucosidase
LAGLDMAMPNPQSFWGANLSLAVTNGSVPESRVTDMATRIIASWYQMGQDKGFPEPGIGMPSDLSKSHKIVDARNASDRPVLYNGAVEGHVLLKNERNALPLRTPKLLSIFGFSARAPDQNNPGGSYSAWTVGGESTSLEEVINAGVALNGTIVSGGGSGATSQSLIVSPFDAVVQQAYEDNTALFWDFTSSSPSVTSGSDACLVVVNAFASESFDRPNIHDDYTDGLILQVAGQCNNTIVIFHTVGARLVDQWIEHPNVTALVFAHLPGQDTGKALVSLLYGQENFSGKLPYTLARNESDYGAVLNPDHPEGIFADFPQSNFTEGVYVDYRRFDAMNITPRYEFGFGLSYTTFAYSGLVIAKIAGANTATYPTGAIRQGGQADLWDVLVEVSAQVKNTGNMDGMEAAQLYLGIPGAPARQLRGFDKEAIRVNETVTVKFSLTRRDMSVWDSSAQKWKLQSGSYGVYVGASSRDLPLNGTVSI